MISVIVSSIGAPFLIDSLRSLTHPPDELLVVVDHIGRTASKLDSQYSLASLESDLAAFPYVRLLHYQPAHENWAVMNGCYNLGWRAARNPYVMFTHDDMEYADYDYFGVATRVLQNVEADGRKVLGRTCTGVLFPEWEVLNGVRQPKNYPEDYWCLSQCVSPVSQVIATWAMEAIGGFDESMGVWYDGMLQAEIHIHNWWSVHLPTPLMRHTSNRTYRLNNWGGGGWSLGRKWGTYSENFKRKYGQDYLRDVGVLEAAQELSDPRFGVHG